MRIATLTLLYYLAILMQMILCAIGLSSKQCHTANLLVDLLDLGKHLPLGHAMSYFSFITTLTLFGTLPEINLFTKDDALEAARIGASGVYHATCHAYVFDDNTIDNILKELFKSTFFILQALQFARTGIYSRTKVDIASQLEGDDASIFKICSNWKENKPKNDTERHNLIDLLLRWSKNIIKIK